MDFSATISIQVLNTGVMREISKFRIRFEDGISMLTYLVTERGG